MLTDVGCNVRVPVLSLLFSDSLIAVTLRTTEEPAGMTTFPAASFTSFAMVAVTVSPTLFLFERISEVVAAVKRVPAAKLAEVAAGAGVVGGAAAGSGLGVVVLGDRVAVEAVGRIGRLGVLAAGAAAVSLGRSFSSAVVSTGASCRSRLRLSAAATSFLSPRPHATAASSASAASLVL